MTNEYRSLKDHVYDHIVDLLDDGTLADDRKIIDPFDDCAALLAATMYPRHPWEYR